MTLDSTCETIKPNILKSSGFDYVLGRMASENKAEKNIF